MTPRRKREREREVEVEEQKKTKVMMSKKKRSCEILKEENYEKYGIGKTFF